MTAEERTTFNQHKRQRKKENKRKRAQQAAEEEAAAMRPFVAATADVGVCRLEEAAQQWQ